MFKLMSLHDSPITGRDPRGRTGFGEGLPQRVRAGSTHDDAVTATVEGTLLRVEPGGFFLVPSTSLAGPSSSAAWNPNAADDVGRDEPSSCEPAAIFVHHDLPKDIDLEPLVGRAVRVTTIYEGDAGEPQSRTLILNDDQGRVWLIARSGKVSGVMHLLSSSDAGPKTELHAALSQRADGPLVIGTSELQWLVAVGATALLHLPESIPYRASLVTRQSDATASYFIADDRLFRDQRASHHRGLASG